MINVSIVIPMYNAEKFIEMTLDSIRLQTLENIEVIIIDDRSTDNSFKLVREKYCDPLSEKFDPRIKLFPSVRKNHEWNNRNIGLQFATGEYVYFMDHDDILLSNAMEYLYNTAEAVQAESVHFISYYTNLDPMNALNDDFRVMKIYDGIEPNSFLPENLEWRLFQDEIKFSPMAWQKLMRRDHLIEVGLYFPDMWISSDSAHFYGELCLTRKIFFLDAIGIIYRQNPTGQMHSDMSKQLTQVLSNFQPLINFMEDIFSKNTIQPLSREVQLHAEIEICKQIILTFADKYFLKGGSK